jgi:hypothetical protein
MSKDARGHGSEAHSIAHNAGIEAAIPKGPKLISEMQRAPLLKAIEKAEAESSRINTALIDMGHGMVKGQDIAKMTGHPIFDQYRENSAKLMALHDEKNYRMRYQGTAHPVKKSRWV